MTKTTENTVRPSAYQQVHAQTEVRVWDWGVRIFHWAWVVAISLAYLTSEWERDVHEWLGYTVLGLLGFRLLWGFIGTPYARFARFWPKPSRLLPYLNDLAKGKEARHLGHNPAGSVMVFVLLALVAAIGSTGWLMTTDWGWGSELLEETHEMLVNGLIFCVVAHVAAVVFESIRHKESLIKGKKRL